MPKITISYRRTDANATGRIYDRLVQRYGKDSIFRDIDRIHFGVDFRKAVHDALNDTNVLLAIVGPNWRGVADGGRVRINEANDLVRIEVETALKRDIPVIPVLIDSAVMPTPTELPDTLTEFSFRNAASVDSGRNFDTDIERLMRSMDAIIDERQKIRAEEEAAALREQADTERKRAEQERAKKEAERAEQKQREKEEREKGKREATELEQKQRDRRRLEDEASQVAKLEQRRKRLEQEPRQWLLPLICTGAACLPTLLLFLLLLGEPGYKAPEWGIFLASITLALYGGVAGVLQRRGVGNRKALALPVIPTLLLLLAIGAVAVFFPTGPADTGARFLTLVVLFFIPAVICVCLALWFYALWERKRQARTSGAV